MLKTNEGVSITAAFCRLKVLSEILKNVSNTWTFDMVHG